MNINNEPIWKITEEYLNILQKIYDSVFIKPDDIFDVSTLYIHYDIDEHKNYNELVSLSSDFFRYNVYVNYKLKTTKEVKIGKFLKDFFKDKLTDRSAVEVEKMVIYTKTMMTNFEPIIISGNAIKDSYFYKNYIFTTDDYMDGIGTLGKSCMRYEDTQPYLDFYTKNRDISLVVTKSSDNKITARALLWKTTEGFTVMDRVYWSYDYQEKMFHQWAESNGYLIVTRDPKKQNIGEGAYHIKSNPELKLTVTLNEYSYSFPYVDYFTYYNVNKNILQNKFDKESNDIIFLLQSTEGGKYLPLNIEEGDMEIPSMEILSKLILMKTENLNFFKFKFTLNYDDFIYLFSLTNDNPTKELFFKLCDLKIINELNTLKKCFCFLLEQNIRLVKRQRHTYDFSWFDAEIIDNIYKSYMNKSNKDIILENFLKTPDNFDLIYNYNKDIITELFFQDKLLKNTTNKFFLNKIYDYYDTKKSINTFPRIGKKIYYEEFEFLKTDFYKFIQLITTSMGKTQYIFYIVNLFSILYIEDKLKDAEIDVFLSDKRITDMISDDIKKVYLRNGTLYIKVLSYEVRKKFFDFFGNFFV